LNQLNRHKNSLQGVLEPLLAGVESLGKPSGPDVRNLTNAAPFPDLLSDAPSRGSAPSTSFGTSTQTQMMSKRCAGSATAKTTAADRPQAAASCRYAEAQRTTADSFNKAFELIEVAHQGRLSKKR
jgi:hypothetical protein